MLSLWTVWVCLWFMCFLYALWMKFIQYLWKQWMSFLCYTIYAMLVSWCINVLWKTHTFYDENGMPGLRKWHENQDLHRDPKTAFLGLTPHWVDLSTILNRSALLTLSGETEGPHLLASQVFIKKSALQSWTLASWLATLVAVAKTGQGSGCRLKPPSPNNTMGV